MIRSDWGYIAAFWSEHGLRALGYPHPAVRDSLADIGLGDAEGFTNDNSSEFAKVLEQQLTMYFKGSPTFFTVPIDWNGYTAFEREVLECTSKIACGRTLTYQEVAAILGRPKAARAVGRALHKNRTPIVIPCHRVIAANGGLAGFSGGIGLKKALLELEKNIVNDLYHRI